MIELISHRSSSSPSSHCHQILHHEVEKPIHRAAGGTLRETWGILILESIHVNRYEQIQVNSTCTLDSCTFQRFMTSPLLEKKHVWPPHAFHPPLTPIGSWPQKVVGWDSCWSTWKDGSNQANCYGLDFHHPQLIDPLVVSYLRLYDRFQEPHPFGWSSPFWSHEQYNWRQFDESNCTIVFVSGRWPSNSTSNLSKKSWKIDDFGFMIQDSFGMVLHCHILPCELCQFHPVCMMMLVLESAHMWPASAISQALFSAACGPKMV